MLRQTEYASILSFNKSSSNTWKSKMLHAQVDMNPNKSNVLRPKRVTRYHVVKFANIEIADKTN